MCDSSRRDSNNLAVFSLSDIFSHDDSSFNSINSNNVHNIQYQGVFLDLNANHNILFNNTVDDIKNGNTIIFTDVWNNSLIMNNIGRSSNDGIYIYQTYESKFLNNTIEGPPTGIYVSHAEANLFEGNSIQGLSNHPINLYMATNNTFLQNVLQTDGSQAIGVYDSHTNKFLNNSLHTTNNYGISIQKPSTINIVRWNSFFGTTWSGGSSLASDEGYDNKFEYNFWEGWNTPDVNQDQIVDTRYLIDGSVMNWDGYPLVLPNIHSLTEPTITYPNKGETISGNVNITWNASKDFWGHKVYYSLYYSLVSSNWIILTENLTERYFLWNTTEIKSEIDVQLLVRAYCTRGLKVTDITDLPFNINNYLEESEESTTPSLYLTTGFIIPNILFMIILWYFYKRR